VSLRRLPRTYLAFVLLSICGPVLVVANGGGRLTGSGAAVVVVALLLFGLARGSRTVWGLFVAFGAVGMLSTFSVSGGGLPPNVLCLLAYNVGSLALLLSPPMRQHVGIRSRHRARAA
jgi:hypothetical protein